MISLLRKPKGTYDLFNEPLKEFKALKSHLETLLERYGYQEIKTPIFEQSEVFHREGELSDMVQKETYNFKDKGDRSLTLRPEGTAGVIRAYIENKMYTNALVKLYYFGPYFRYERPQKGRFRQFYQVGMEAIGEKSPLLDAEIISLSYQIINSLGLKDVTIYLNSLGDRKAQINYKDTLKAYFTPYKDELCGDCQRRITENPLRILDCKIDQNKKFVKNAPISRAFLNAEDLKYYHQLKEYLTAMNVSFKEDDKLVRGLDYYTQTVFEIKADIEGFGAHNVLGGGGHYENLVSDLGGPQRSGTGVAFGIERLLEALKLAEISLAKEEIIDVYLIQMTEKAALKALEVITSLRKENFTVYFDYYQRSFRAQLKEALTLKARYLIIIGEDELANNYFTLKNTKTEKQEKVTLEKMIRTIRKDDNTQK